MNIGYFGGTFDPIHRGHLKLGAAALEHFTLGKVFFVTSGHPPHRSDHKPAGFADRHAMVTLATQGEKQFVPALFEEPDGSGKPNYSIDTVRTLKKSLRKSDRLMFIIGIDAFMDIAKWREAAALLRECQFIVASRPGYSLSAVAGALPEKLRPKAAALKVFEKTPASGQLVLPGVNLHFLDSVHEKVSATEVRRAIRENKSLSKMLDERVIEYIRKRGLYKGVASKV